MPLSNVQPKGFRLDLGPVAGVSPQRLTSAAQPRCVAPSATATTTPSPTDTSEVGPSRGLPGVEQTVQGRCHPQSISGRGGKGETRGRAGATGEVVNVRPAHAKRQRPSGHGNGGGRGRAPERAAFRLQPHPCPGGQSGCRARFHTESGHPCPQGCREVSGPGEWTSQDSRVIVLSPLAPPGLVGRPTLASNCPGSYSQLQTRRRRFCLAFRKSR